MIRPIERHGHEGEHLLTRLKPQGFSLLTAVPPRALWLGLRLLRAYSIAYITVVGISSRYWSLSVIGSTVPGLFLTGVDGGLVSEVNMGTSTDKAGDESVGEVGIGDFVIGLEGVTDFALGVEELDDDDFDEDDDVFDEVVIIILGCLYQEKANQESGYNCYSPSLRYYLSARGITPIQLINILPLRRQLAD
ncbi:hypothetical protein FF38_12381 [Lucilia cuprina]|uniref:Uncharacterized protein n=1 Tax=Lucilia cuprina TaxID=7375 RepID=A0A0L0BW47_LUCCU|nr:hypothetical protein FF38_12381 [Lucilia cuprina]